MIELEWKFLSVEQLHLSEKIQLLAAWTGNAASTKNLVAEIKKMKTQRLAEYQQFLQASEKAVEMIADGIRLKSMSVLFTGIDKNRQALKALGLLADVPIETVALEQIAVIAEQFNGVESYLVLGAVTAVLHFYL